MEYQASPFEPIRNFDVPGVALNQILTNRASMESIGNLLIPARRAHLTPEEQVSIAERFKDQYGGDNKILRTMLGIATNPWIWMGAMVTPAGATAIKGSGRLFASGLQVAKGINTEGHWMEKFGAFTPMQSLDGTVMATAVQMDIELRNGLEKAMGEVMKKGMLDYYKTKEGVDILRAHGIKNAPGDLDEWLQVVGKQLGFSGRKLKKFNKRIFNAGYRGYHKEHAELITQQLGIELKKGHQDIERAIASFEPPASIRVRTESEALKVGAHQEWLYHKKLSETSARQGAKKNIPEKGLDVRISYDQWLNFNAANKIAKEQTGSIKHTISLDKSKVELITRMKREAAIQEPGVTAAANKAYHLEPMVRGYRAALDARGVMLYGDDLHYAKTGEFLIDPNKVKSIAAAMDPSGGNAKLFFQAGAHELVSPEVLSQQGMDMLKTLFTTDDLKAAMSMPAANRQKLFEELITATVKPMWDSKTYLPRNTFQMAEGGFPLGHPSQIGSKMKPNPNGVGGIPTTSTWDSLTVQSAENQNQLLVNAPALASRTKASQLFHPHVYERLIRTNKMFGGTTGTTPSKVAQGKYPESMEQILHRKLNDSLTKIAHNTKEDIVSQMSTLDGINSYNRYAKDTGEIFSRNIAHKVTDAKGNRVYNTHVYGELLVQDTLSRGKGLPAAGGQQFNDIFRPNTKWRPSGKVDPKTGWVEEPALWGEHSLEDLMYGKSKHLAPAGDITLGDIMTMTHNSMVNPHAKNMTRDVLIPHISARKLPKDSTARALQIKTQETLESFANSALGKTIESWGAPGKEFIDSMKNMANPGISFSGQAAKGLYVGFLGSNMMSVMLNLMQPFLHTTMYAGLDNVLPAYKEAFLEMAGYAKERAKHGFIISPAKRAEIMQMKSGQGGFKHVREGLMGDLTGMQPDIYASLEGASYVGVQANRAESVGHWLAMTAPMKLFEKAELFNRLVTLHTADRMFKRYGGMKEVAKRPSTLGAWNEAEQNLFKMMADSRRLTQEAQFGGTALNMPSAFLGDTSPLGGVLSNPLMRQFLSFITRAATTFGVTGKQISPYRTIRGTNLKIPYYVGDFLRVMGTGAIAYEVGKEVFGMDQSRGTGFNPMVEVMGGGWKPPVVSIPLDMVKLVTGDIEFAKSSIPGLVPNGIALVRALGMAPALGNQSFLPEMAKNFQRSYVDWNTTTPDGHHPVFKGDGSLVSYDSPFEIVTRGLGLNLGDHPKAGEVDGYLVGQRELIVKMESEYMQALISNNIAKAMAIEAMFKKKFNIPLKISKSQWRRRMRNLETIRLERIADTIPKEYKELYTSTLVQERKAMGLQESEINLGTTSGRRSKAGAERTSTVKLDPATIELIKKHLQQQEIQGKPVEEQSFDPFKSWNK